MANLMQLDIVTPDKMLLHREDISMLSFYTSGGSIGIKANHLPFIGDVMAGKFKFADATEENFESIDVLGGFVEFKNNKATLLCTIPQTPEEVAAALKEKKRRDFMSRKEDLIMARAKVLLAKK